MAHIVPPVFRLLAILSLSGCGARTVLGAPELTGGGDAAPPDTLVLEPPNTNLRLCRGLRALCATTDGDAVAVNQFADFASTCSMRAAVSSICTEYFVEVDADGCPVAGSEDVQTHSEVRSSLLECLTRSLAGKRWPCASQAGNTSHFLQAQVGCN